MGTSGCVSFMFTSKGVIVVENTGLDEEKVMEDVFDLGATDFNIEGDSVEITTEPADMGTVRDGLTEKGYKILQAEVEKVPSTYTTLTDEDAIRKMGLLLEHLEDNDDVQNVWHNWDMPEEAE